MTARPSIELHIERLVLEGLPLTSRQGTLVPAAIETAMVRLLADGDLAASLRSDAALSSVRAGTIYLTPNSPPSQLGRQIATTIYGALSLEFPSDQSSRASHPSDHGSNPPSQGERG